MSDLSPQHCTPTDSTFADGLIVNDETFSKATDVRARRLLMLKVLSKMRPLKPFLTVGVEEAVQTFLVLVSTLPHR
jgi:hypothetical protein